MCKIYNVYNNRPNYVYLFPTGKGKAVGEKPATKHLLVNLYVHPNILEQQHHRVFLWIWFLLDIDQTRQERKHSY